MSDSKMDRELMELRDDLLAAEFPAVERDAVLRSVLDAAPPAQVLSMRKRSRRLVGVAAAISLLAGGGFLLQLAPFGAEEKTPGASWPGTQVVAPPPAAAATLPELAQRAEKRPAVPDGAFLQVSTTQSDGRRCEQFYDSQAWVWLQCAEADGRTLYAVHESPVGPLPAEVDGLRVELRRRASGTESVEQALFKEVGEVVAEPTLGAQTRSSAIKLLAELAEQPVRSRPRPKDPGVTTPQITVATEEQQGQPVLIARFRDQTPGGAEMTLVFDARTSVLLQRSAAGMTTDFVPGRTVDRLPEAVVAEVGTQRNPQMVLRP